MDKAESSAHAHLPDEDHELDTVEAHYSYLERPHACLNGYVYVGHLAEGEDGEELEVIKAYACHRCAREGI